MRRGLVWDLQKIKITCARVSEDTLSPCVFQISCVKIMKTVINVKSTIATYSTGPK